MNAATRADDERLLEMLRLRDEGVSSAVIGRMFGITSSRVRTMTNAVRAEVSA